MCFSEILTCVFLIALVIDVLLKIMCILIGQELFYMCIKLYKSNLENWRIELVSETVNHLYCYSVQNYMYSIFNYHRSTG